MQDYQLLEAGHPGPDKPYVIMADSDEGALEMVLAFEPPRFWELWNHGRRVAEWSDMASRQPPTFA